MHYTPIVDVSSKMRRDIKRAQDAADQTAPDTLPGNLTRELDPPIPVSGLFLEYLRGNKPEGASDLELTRARLLDLGRGLGHDPSDRDITNYLISVNAWGYGASGYGPSRTRRVVSAQNFISSARGALALLRDSTRLDAAAEAYYYLNNRPGHVPGWGPAFFTKFLAFADPMNQRGVDVTRDPALVLDRWMAKAMNNIAGFDAGRATPPRAIGRYSNGGWTTPQYAYYLRFVRRIADESLLGGDPARYQPKDVERILFQYFRDGDGSRKAVTPSG